MLIMNQKGDEIINMQNVITIKVCKQTINGSEIWAVNANIIEGSQYARLGEYKTESKAKKVLYDLFEGGYETFKMPVNIDGD